MENEVAAAARRTLARGSARVAHRYTSDPPGRIAVSGEGVTDLRRFRTRVEFTADGFAEFVTRVLERNPWLADGDDPGEERAYMVYPGTASFFGDGERWAVIGEGDVTAPRRTPTDPVWIVEALKEATIAVRAQPDEVVRSAPCARWDFRADRGRPTAGTVWIDGDGLIRRVRGREVELRRPRMPRRRPPGPIVWSTTDLWDFGLPVEIEVPVVERDRTPWPVALVQVGWELRRRKGAYERGRL